MALSQQQKTFLDKLIVNCTTSGELLNCILGEGNGGGQFGRGADGDSPSFASSATPTGSNPGLPGTVNPPGPRGVKSECVQYLSSLQNLTPEQITIILGIV